MKMLLSASCWFADLPDLGNRMMKKSRKKKNILN